MLRWLISFRKGLHVGFENRPSHQEVVDLYPVALHRVGHFPGRLFHIPNPQTNYLFSRGRSVLVSPCILTGELRWVFCAISGLRPSLYTDSTECFDNGHMTKILHQPYCQPACIFWSAWRVRAESKQNLLPFACEIAPLTIQLIRLPRGAVFYKKWETVKF